MAIDHDHGWCSVPLSQFVERLTRRNLELDSNVLTISATRGLVSQRDYFGKQIASENLASYYRLLRGEFAYNKSYSAGYPLGAIKRLDAYDSGVVSPLYICFSLTREDVALSDYFVQYVEAGRLDENLRAIAAEGARNHGLLNVKPAEFLSLPVTLPPLPEQKKIAAILSSVDETIAKTEAVIAQLQIVKKAMMEQLLTKGMPGRHTRFKQTEIGEIPEEWEVGTIGSYCQVDNHLRTPIRLDERERNPGPYPYYGPTKVLNHIGTFNVEGRYVLIGEDGDHFLKYATWAMTQLVDGRFNVNNHAHLIRGVGTCSTEWVYQYFKHRDLTSVLTRQGANRYKLTKAGLTDLRFPVPRLSEQQEIHSAIESIERRIFGESLTKEAHLSLKSALSSSLLSGELRVIPEVAE